MDYHFYLNNKSVKNTVIALLSVNWPLSTNDIHKEVVKEQGIKISYQAVHKAIKQLVESGCLQIENKKYSINEEWVKEISEIVNQIKRSYKGKFHVSKTILNKEGNKFNVIIAKNGLLRDIMMEKTLVNYLKDLIPILKKEINPHNIFQKNEDEVLTYLLNIQKEHEFFIALINEKVIGGTVLEKKDESIRGDHKVWKLKHFALSEDIEKNTEKEIISEIENRLKKKSKSLKIQVNLSEKETRAIELFKRNNYKKEATLDNHYRINEKMFIYAKSINS